MTGSIVFAVGLFGLAAIAVLYPFWAAQSAATRFANAGCELHFKNVDSTSPWIESAMASVTSQPAMMVKGIIADPKRSTLTDKDLATLKVFPVLSYLDLTNQQITTAGMLNLAGLKIDGLYLSGTRVGSGCNLGSKSPFGLSPLERLPNLTSLNLSRTCVVDADLDVVKKLPRITQLYLDDTQVTASGLVNLSGHRFYALSLSGTRIDDSADLLLSHTEQLHLDLSRTKVTGKSLSKLKVDMLILKLQNSEANDEGMRCISLLPIKFLCLDISETNVSSRGLAYFESVPQLSRLTIEGANFHDDHLAEVAKIPNLYELELMGARVTSKGFEKLSALKELNSLRFDAHLLKDPQVIAALRRIPKLSYISSQTGFGDDLDDAEIQRQLGPRISLFVNRVGTHKAGL